MINIVNHSFSPGIDQSECMFVAIALNQDSGGLPDVLDVTLIESWEALVSFKGKNWIRWNGSRRYLWA